MSGGLKGLIAPVPSCVWGDACHWTPSLDCEAMRACNLAWCSRGILSPWSWLRKNTDAEFDEVWPQFVGIAQRSLRWPDGSRYVEILHDTDPAKVTLHVDNRRETCDKVVVFNLTAFMPGEWLAVAGKRADE